MGERDRAGRPEDLGREAKAVLKLLGRRELTVGELVERAVSELGLKRHEAARAIYRLRDAGLVAILDPSPPESLLRFVLSSRATWFWVLLSVVLLADASIYLLPQSPPFIYARYIFGSLFVLYLPGASLIELLYPKRGDITQLERVALSIGLSLALVPLVGLVLNYTPWGIRLDPVVFSLSALTTALAFGAVVRKHAYHVLLHGSER